MTDTKFQTSLTVGRISLGPLDPRAHVEGKEIPHFEMLRMALDAEAKRDADVWNRAIEAAKRAVSDCRSLDSNGYICEKADVIQKLRELERAT